MANLIVAKDVLACFEKGQTTCYIDPGTIITPAAKDEAKKRGVTFVDCQQPCSKQETTCNGDITSDELLSLLKKC